MAKLDKNPVFGNLPPINLGNGKVRYQLTAKSVAIRAQRPGSMTDPRTLDQPIPPVIPKPDTPGNPND